MEGGHHGSSVRTGGLQCASAVKLSVHGKPEVASTAMHRALKAGVGRAAGQEQDPVNDRVLAGGGAGGFTALWAPSTEEAHLATVIISWTKQASPAAGSALFGSVNWIRNGLRSFATAKLHNFPLRHNFLGAWKQHTFKVSCRGLKLRLLSFRYVDTLLSHFQNGTSQHI